MPQPAGVSDPHPTENGDFRPTTNPTDASQSLPKSNFPQNFSDSPNADQGTRGGEKSAPQKPGHQEARLPLIFPEATQRRASRIERDRAQCTLSGLSAHDRKCCAKALLSEAARFHHLERDRIAPLRYNLTNRPLAVTIAQDVDVLMRGDVNYSTSIGGEVPFSGNKDNYACVMKELAKLHLWQPNPYSDDPTES